MKDLPGDTRATGAGDVPSPSIVPGERSSLCRQREAPTEILSPSPDTVSGVIAPHCPPPMEGAGGGRGSAPGGGGGRRIPFNQRHRRQGGCSIPLPVSPSPTGVIPPRYGVRGKHHLSRFQARNSSQILSPSPDTAIGPIAPHCPPPLEGAGGGRGAAGRWGWSTNTVQPETQETEEGDVPSPSPASPSPAGAIPHRYGVRGKHHLSRFQARNSSQILSPPPVTAIGPIAPYCPPPLEGAGGGRGAAGRWGCLYLPRKKSVWLICRRQGRGMLHPPPRQPLPHGGDSP